MENEQLYTLTLFKANGDVLATYYDQDIHDANFIVSNALKDGYPVPEFNGISQELNEYMDIRIEKQEYEECQPCGYDAVLDSKLNNY